MTREEREFAKSRIEYLLKISSFVFDERDREALEAAIQALSQEPTVTSTDEPMTMVYPTIVCDDAISREAVKDILNNSYSLTDAEHRVEQLPSVTQKPIECDDTVSRQAVLEGLKGCICEEWVKTLFATMVKQLPSVTQKSGYWIDDADKLDSKYGRHLFRCIYCDTYADDFVGGTENWWDIKEPNYCPNCGTKMVEPQERSDKE